jgi:hypothetical protein
LLPAIVITVSLVLGLGLAYFVFIGVRAIYRGATQTAREAGHPLAAARARAILRMAIWSVFFGLLYGFLYFMGRKIGWWALIPGVLALAMVIASLLQTDRLLTTRREEVQSNVSIALTILSVMALLASVTWYAAASR